MNTFWQLFSTWWPAGSRAMRTRTEGGFTKRSQVESNRSTFDSARAYLPNLFMRSTEIKLLLVAALVAVVLHSHAETKPAEHAWVIGSNGNYYGIVQWGDSNRATPERKRTVVFFGAYEHTVHQPAILVAGLGLFGLSSLVLIPLAMGSRMRKRPRNETIA
jgi:hypothetical protein